MARGTVYLIFANGVLLITGYIIHFGVGRYLGPTDYGLFGVVLALMTTVNIVVTSGFPQGASKYIAEGNSATSGIMRAGNRVQMVSTMVVFSLYFGLAGVVAHLLNDLTLTPYIRISALAVPAYAFYSIYSSGYLNGLRQFTKQATISVATSIAKLAVVFTLIFLGLGVKGAIGGYAIAALLGLILAQRLLGHRNRHTTNFEWQKLISFGVPATLFAVLFFLLLNIDLFLVKVLTSIEAEVGYYTSATTIAKLPYSMFVGLAMTLLPSISRSISINDVELTKSHITQSMRYMLMLLIPGVLLVSATSTKFVTLAYSSQYANAATPLSILIFGMGLLSVFYVLANVIMGSGRPTIALGITLPLIGLDILLNVLMIPKYGLTGAAIATTGTGFIGMTLVSAYVLWQFKALMSLKSFGRICLASLLVYGIALSVQFSFFWLPLLYVVLFATYVGILVLMRELGKGDWKTFKKLLTFDKLLSAE